MKPVAPGIVIDGHVDTLQRLPGLERDPVLAFLAGTGSGHLDLPRALAGGLRAGLFSVYPPAGAYAAPDEAARFACARTHASNLLGLLQRLEAASAGRFRRVTDMAGLESCLGTDALGAILHFEGLEPIGADLGALAEYYGSGLRSAGLAWQQDNRFAGVATADPARHQHGLTDLGREAVRECNRLGLLVDVSHLNEASFADVARISSAPLVATHSNAYALSPHCRNLRDGQLDAIRDSGGLVGVMFCVAFLRAEPWTAGDPGLEAVVRQVDYIASRLGIDHVAFGSDFDGADIPAEIGDASGYPRLAAALRRHGFDAASIAKVTHENWLRVLRATWRPAGGAGP